MFPQPICNRQIHAFCRHRRINYGGLNMKDTVLWRKQSQLVMLLSNALNITPEEALDKFYTTDTYKKLSSQKFGLHLMSDMYLLEELIAELSANKLTTTTI